MDLQVIRAAILEHGDEVAINLALGRHGKRGLAILDAFNQQHVVRDIRLRGVDDSRLRKRGIIDRPRKRQALGLKDVDIKTLRHRTDSHVVNQGAVAALDREHRFATRHAGDGQLVGRDIRLFDFDNAIGRRGEAVDRAINRHLVGLAKIDIEPVRNGSRRGGRGCVCRYRRLRAAQHDAESQQAQQRDEVTG